MECSRDLCRYALAARYPRIRSFCCLLYLRNSGERMPCGAPQSRMTSQQELSNLYLSVWTFTRDLHSAPAASIFHIRLLHSYSTAGLPGIARRREQLDENLLEYLMSSEFSCLM
jgi:hypothetical protein